MIHIGGLHPVPVSIPLGRQCQCPKCGKIWDLGSHTRCTYFHKTLKGFSKTVWSLCENFKGNCFEKWQALVISRYGNKDIQLFLETDERKVLWDEFLETPLDKLPG